MATASATPMATFTKRPELKGLVAGGGGTSLGGAPVVDCGRSAVAEAPGVAVVDTAVELGDSGRIRIPHANSRVVVITSV